jgi:hypothetical protein
MKKTIICYIIILIYLPNKSIMLIEHLVVECLPSLYIEGRLLIYGKERFFNLHLTYYYHIINSTTLHYFEVVLPINKNGTHLSR